MKYTDIPHRRWRDTGVSDDEHHAICELVTSKVYPRVMKRMGDAIAAGKKVTMEHVIVNPQPVIDKPYDTITVTIED